MPNGGHIACTSCCHWKWADDFSSALCSLHHAEVTALTLCTAFNHFEEYNNKNSRFQDIFCKMKHGIIYEVTDDTYSTLLHPQPIYEVTSFHHPQDNFTVKQNKKILDDLFQNNQINVRRGAIFDIVELPFKEAYDHDRVEGMMLGLAIGDALGITTEGMTPGRRREMFGEIRDYLPNRYVNLPIGFPSDDTQLAFWTLEQMIKDGCFIPDHVAKRFCTERIFGIGSTVKGFLRNYKSGKSWYESGPKSAGNGALMRIAPMVIPHLRPETTGLWVDTVLSAMMTHNDSASISACLAFICMIRQLLVMDIPPDPHWWLETYVQMAKDLEIDETYSPRGGNYSDYVGSLWCFLEGKVGDAYRKNLSVMEACNSWYSGAYLLETVPSAIYILMRHGHNMEEALIRAVNDTKDNDTIAAIVGAAVGALHGKKAIPDRWLEKLSGRTGENDDGRVFTLLDMAKQCF